MTVKTRNLSGEVSVKKLGKDKLELTIHGISSKGNRWAMLTPKQARLLAIDLLKIAEGLETY